MKKLALALILSLSPISTVFAASNVSPYSESQFAIQSATEDEIINYVSTKFREHVINIEAIAFKEDVLAYTESGKVYLITIVNGIIINGEEEPIN